MSQRRPDLHLCRYWPPAAGAAVPCISIVGGAASPGACTGWPFRPKASNITASACVQRHVTLFAAQRDLRTSRLLF